MQIDKAQLWHAGLFTVRHIASALLIFGVIGYLAKPHAQDFVREAVDDRIEKLEQQMGEVQSSMNEQKRAQDVMANEIENLGEVTRDTKSDTRMILRSIQGLRGDLREE